MRPSATSEVTDARGTLDRITVLFVLLLCLGPVIVSRIGVPGLLNPGTGVNTFFVQYREHEPIFLALLGAFLVAVAVLARRQAPYADDDGAQQPLFALPRITWLWVGAAVVFAITALGTWGVMHSFPASMDEFVAVFQSRVLASGRVTTVIPDAWKPFGQALTPVFIGHDAERSLWMAQYLPLYAVLRAPFVASGADRLVNPALAAMSVVLVYACARRLWPAHPHRAWIAAAFLASSTQLLFMSMTAFSMPAHLMANLCWLYAYLRGDRAGWIAAPVIGIAALGLHNPFPHALFVAPFLVHFVLRKRWAWTAYFGLVYLAGIVAWYTWMRSVGMRGTTAATNVFAIPGAIMMGVQHLSLTLVFSWQTPIFALSLAWLLAGWRRLETAERLLAAGVALSFAFFYWFASTQGHGWGYRYTFPVLGNLVLLAALGTDMLTNALGRVVVRRVLVASLVLTALVQLPLRAWQVERYVRPFASLHAHMTSIDADVVIVDPTSSWYGIDLVRNDPFLQDQPKVLSAFYLRANEKRLLAERFGSRVHLLRAEEIERFGIPIFPSRFKKGIWPPRVE